MPKEVMTATDLAEYLGFSKNWIYRKAEAGEIPATKFGNRWRFKKSVIDKWVEKRLRGAELIKGNLAQAAGLEGRLAEGLRLIQASQGGVTSADYAAKFEISLATARKDLNELIKRKLIRKLGGGRNIHYTVVG